MFSAGRSETPGDCNGRKRKTGFGGKALDLIRALDGFGQENASDERQEEQGAEANPLWYYPFLRREENGGADDEDQNERCFGAHFENWQFEGGTRLKSTIRALWKIA